MQFFEQLNWQALLEDHGYPLAIMGLVVVFGALILVRVFIGTLPRIMAILDYYLPEHKESAAQPVAAQSPADDQLPSEIVAVIAAAVAATVGKPHRIVHTRQLEGQNWSLEGRKQHHESHKVRPPRKQL